MNYKAIQRLNRTTKVIAITGAGFLFIGCAIGAALDSIMLFDSSRN